MSIVKRLNDFSTVQQFKYFKILIQEFHIKVDIGFINGLMKIFEAGEVSETDEVYIILCTVCQWQSFLINSILN